MIIILTVIMLVLLSGIINYSYQRKNAKAIDLEWFDKDNIERINGVNVHIFIKGEGEPLLLVHGSQFNIYDWRYNIDFFSKYFKVYAFDMVGCGFTDKPKNASYSPEYFAGFIDTIMNYYNIKKASFIASSWGGGHVFYYALKNPERIDKLVMSSPCGLPHKMTPLDTLLGLPVLNKIIMLFGTRSLLIKELKKIFYKHEFITPELVNSIYKPLYMDGGLNATVKSYENDNFSYVESNFENIKVPVLLIWGDKDRIHQKWMIEEINNRIPNCKLIIFSNTGHLPHEEEHEKFNECALKFLLENK